MKAEIIGIVIAVDRQERGVKSAALAEFTEKTGIDVHAIENIDNIFKYLKENEVAGKTYVDDKTFAKYKEYIRKYGAL
jgi:orotate phosphoribosyltransferase